MTKKTFTISRTFNAPQALVWKANTEAEHLMKWWGPKGLTMKVAKVDLKPGGMFHYGMTAPDGSEMWGRFVFQEVDPISRLVYIVSFSDAEGAITRHPMAPKWPAEIHTTMTLTEHEGKTTLTMTGYPINCNDEESDIYYSNFENMNAGFAGTFDQLESYLNELKK
jgi:uncharacterized protein YndB with AHSA1/START domain